MGTVEKETYTNRVDADTGGVEEGRGDGTQRIARGRSLVGQPDLAQETNKAK